MLYPVKEMDANIEARITLMVLAFTLQPSFATGQPVDDPAWKIQTIDDSSRGADGVRLGDINSDGLPDLVTEWEQGNLVRVYLNPGPAQSKSKWPAVTVGAAPNVEDAVFVDLDADGTKYDRIELIDLDNDGDLDVLTCEEKTNLGVIWFENPTR